MSWQFQSYAIVLVLTTVIALEVAFIAWRQRATPGALTFAILMLAMAEWTFTSGLEVAAMGLASKLVWAKAEYLGSALGSTLLLIFAFQYIRQDKWLTRRNVALLWIIPFCTILLALTNEWHHLIWTSFTPSPFGDNIIIYGHGTWFWIAMAYYYSCLFFTALALIRAMVRFPLLRHQAAALLLGSIVAWGGSIIYNAGLSPVPGIDITPIAFALTGLIIAWGVFRFRLFDLVPVARDVLIENMSDGVLVLDEQNRILDMNPSARQVIGVASVAAIGRPAADVLAAWPDLLARYCGVMQAQDEIAFGQDKLPHLELRISPLYDKGGRFTGRLIVFRDITERKQAEQELRRSNAELQARNEELDAFAHTVAHDIRNPVSHIIGYTEMLEQDYESMLADERQEYLHSLARIGNKVNNILDELLLLAGLRKTEVALAPLDMGNIVAEACRRLSHMIEENQAELALPAEWPSALGYAPWVEEVWVNYLSNAIQYGGHPPRVELGAEVLPPLTSPSLAAGKEGGRMVRFWVRDNGDGIAPEDQSRLFTPFTRLDQVRARGHGLGLSIVRRIMEKLDGQVSVTSDGLLGRGSEFSFTLPAVTSSSVPE
jgi:PAS domain S-box-containing protein